MREALYYERLRGQQVRCHLCRFNCLIDDGKRGICRVRENRNGILYSLVYGKLCAENVDPIEKKPLYHVMPGSRSFSIATVGCNFRCRHCQNYSISQVSAHARIPGNEQPAEEVVKKALASRCRSISYTYTEPTIFFEYALDVARLANASGLKNVFVTNGYIGKEALAEIAPVLDAANIDLKGFSEAFYRDVVHARLPEVLDSIIEYRRLGIWLELTTLVIPGLNDSEAELQGIASFIARNLGCDTPWHVSQFHPTFQLTDRPRTAPDALRRAAEIGRAAGLKFVYEGNLPGQGGENSRCPSCAALLIERYGYVITANRLKEGACPECGATVPGVAM